MPAPKGFFKKSKAPEGRPGVYLDGGFGVGKTHLLAALWHAAPQPKSFGTFVEYTNVIGLLGFRNAVEQFANRQLVCIDEFELDDPGDTVLMSTFLNELVDRGVNVAATSNTLPDRLGEERFAADNFLREIQGLSAHFDVIRIEGPDYRQRNLDVNQKVFTHSEVERICEATFHAAMDEWQGLLDHLSMVHPAQYGPMVEDLSLLGLQNVNVVRNENQALRVVSLVDRLYDRSVPIVNSGVDITNIFTDSMLTGGYRKKYFRALSRLAALAQMGAVMVE
jgi:cell division protein ZapE